MKKKINKSSQGNIKDNNFEVSLNKFRDEIDKTDCQILELLQKRMLIINQVGELKSLHQQKFFIRSNREADMIKNLIVKMQDNHKKLSLPELPIEAIIDIWRKIISSANIAEQEVKIAIYNPSKINDYNLLINQYYQHSFTSANFVKSAKVLKMLDAKEYQIAIFNLLEKSKDNVWWLEITKYSHLKIFTKIPFYQFSNQQKIELIAVADKECEASQADYSYLVIKNSELDQKMITKLLKKNNIKARFVDNSQSHKANNFLIEVEGFYLNDSSPIIDLIDFIASAGKKTVGKKTTTELFIIGHSPVPIKI